MIKYCALHLSVGGWGISHRLTWKSPRITKPWKEGRRACSFSSVISDRQQIVQPREVADLLSAAPLTMPSHVLDFLARPTRSKGVSYMMIRWYE